MVCRAEGSNEGSPTARRGQVRRSGVTNSACAHRAGLLLAAPGCSPGIGHLPGHRDPAGGPGSRPQGMTKPVGLQRPWPCPGCCTQERPRESTESGVPAQPWAPRRRERGGGGTGKALALGPKPGGGGPALPLPWLCCLDKALTLSGPQPPRHREEGGLL